MKLAKVVLMSFLLAAGLAAYSWGSPDGDCQEINGTVESVDSSSGSDHGNCEVAQGTVEDTQVSEDAPIVGGRVIIRDRNDKPVGNIPPAHRTTYDQDRAWRRYASRHGLLNRAQARSLDQDILAKAKEYTDRKSRILSNAINAERQRITILAQRLDDKAAAIGYRLNKLEQPQASQTPVVEQPVEDVNWVETATGLLIGVAIVGLIVAAIVGTTKAVTYLQQRRIARAPYIPIRTSVGFDASLREAEEARRREREAEKPVTADDVDRAVEDSFRSRAA